VVDLTPEGTVRSYYDALNARDDARARCAVAEVERGRIVRYRDYDDRASLYAQLELMGLFNP